MPPPDPEARTGPRRRGRCVRPEALAGKAHADRLAVRPRRRQDPQPPTRSPPVPGDRRSRGELTPTGRAPFVGPDGYERITNGVTNGRLFRVPRRGQQKPPYFERTGRGGPIPHGRRETPGNRKRGTNAGTSGPADAPTDGETETLPPKGFENSARVKKPGGEVKGTPPPLKKTPPGGMGNREGARGAYSTGRMLPHPLERNHLTGHPKEPHPNGGPMRSP